MIQQDSFGVRLALPPSLLSILQHWLTPILYYVEFKHCSLASASVRSQIGTTKVPGRVELTSPPRPFSQLCTVKHIQTYLLKGDLPNENVFCKVDEVLFPEAGVSCFINDHDEEATRVLQAAREVGEALRSFHVSF